MKILNTEKEDYHVHSLNFSDGMNTIDEVVKYAGELGMKKIVFADHCQANLDKWGMGMKNVRGTIKPWKNIHNEVEVIFGVEADLLNEKGDVCTHIQGLQGEFIILSFHPETYADDRKTLTNAYINALEKHHKMIGCIGHLHVNCEGVDIAKVVEVANKYDVPLELNCKYLSFGWGDDGALKLILSKAKSIYVNSDCHRLSDLRDYRKLGFKFLRDNGFLKE